MINENTKRLGAHKKDTELEQVLAELETILGNVSVDLPVIGVPGQPIIFIMGCARSGSTLLMQYLAEYANVCYPTNFLSRFYFSPYVGALYQKVMYDLDHKGELLRCVDTAPDFNSELGKTRGPLAPNEFWYFWRRHFRFGETQCLSDADLAKSSPDQFLNEVRMIPYVFQKPLVLKGMIMNWNIPVLAGLFDNAYFLFVERDVRYNAQSLLKARIDFYGDPEEWYSFKTPDYSILRELCPEEQVVRQVLSTNAAIEEGLSRVSGDRCLKIRYEEFCEDPVTLLEKLAEKIEGFGFQGNDLTFPVSTKLSVPREVWSEINTFTQNCEA